MEALRAFNNRNMEISNKEEANDIGRGYLEMRHLKNTLFKRLSEEEEEKIISPSWRRAAFKRFLRLHTRED